MAIAFAFSLNHIGARLAIDHGVSVLTAVTVRSSVTVLAVGALIVWSGIRLRLDAATVPAAIATGIALALQGFCLYSAVARLPVALALLVFNTFPILIALLTWLCAGERPRLRTVAAWPVILMGLGLALDIPAVLASMSAEIGSDARTEAKRMLAGVGFGLGAAASFAAAMVISSARLGHLDGRVRSALTMCTVAILAGSVGWFRSDLALPADGAGWTGLAILTLFYALAITSLFVILPLVGAVNSSPILNVEPIFAMGLAALFLDQTLNTSQMVGAALVVGAIVALSMAPRPAN
jgi:drug/metabolite transporter (DMT)-like permease